MGFDSGSSSSEEIGDQAEDQKIVSDNAVPASRFYECTYCKRGFTNAQALGGHMNIHRKEKAQAKQQKSANKRQQPRKSDEDVANCSTSTTTTHPRYYEHQNYEVTGDHQQMNGNYSYQQQHYFFPAPGYDHGDLGHANKDRGEDGESEVDLELRLGLALK